MIRSRVALILEDKCRAASGSHEVPTAKLHEIFHTPEIRSSAEAASFSWNDVTKSLPTKNNSWAAWKTRYHKHVHGDGTNHKYFPALPENVDCQNSHTSVDPAACHIMQRSQRFASTSRPAPKAMADRSNQSCPPIQINSRFSQQKFSLSKIQIAWAPRLRKATPEPSMKLRIIFEAASEIAQRQGYQLATKLDWKTD